MVTVLGVLATSVEKLLKRYLPLMLGRKMLGER